MKKMTEQIEWSWSDGWLLMALFLAQGTRGARLFELIATADMTNHAIPTAKEISSALTKFARCRLVAGARGRYLLSRRHLPAIRKAYEGRGGLFSAGDKGLKWLKQTELALETEKRVDISEAELARHMINMLATHELALEKSRICRGLRRCVSCPPLFWDPCFSDSRRGIALGWWLLHLYSDKRPDALYGRLQQLDAEQKAQALQELDPEIRKEFERRSASEGNS